MVQGKLTKQIIDGTVTDFLQENAETYLAAIVTNSNDAIIGKTLSGIVTSWNPGAEKLYGYKKEEIIGQSIRLIYPDSLKKELKDILSKISRDEKIDSFETIRLAKDGRPINVSISVSPIKNQAGKVIGCSDITRDISEKKRMEVNQNFLVEASEVLSSSLDYNTTLQSVARLAIQHIADWCAVDLLQDGETFTKLFAIAHKDPKKEEWAKSLRKNLPKHIDSPRGVANVIRTGKPEFYPYLDDEMIKNMAVDKKQLKLITEIGIRSVMIVPLKVRNKSIGAITFVSSTKHNLFDQHSLNLAEDLAIRASYAIDSAILYKNLQDELEERNRAESALKESEYKFKKLFESSIIGVVITNVDGTVYEANKTFLDMIGYDFKDLKEGRIHWQKITPEKWFESDALAIEQVLNYGEALPREKEYIRRNGTTIPVLIGTALLDKEKGNCLTFILDITDQKEVEQRKDDFISIASHELKTPVTSIKVFTQLLAKRFERQADEQAAGLIKKMDTQLNKLISLISDLLDVSRIESGKLALRPEQFLLNEIIEENIEAVKETTNHKFVYKDGTPIKVYGDRERIGQVITNFLTNAIKYSSSETEIGVTIRTINDQVEVSVKDSGVGIAEEDQKQIFERFYQAKNSHLQTYPGLGMGLYISAEIIKRHHGKIWVESKKGEGSNFFFTIPLHNYSLKEE